MSESNRRIQNIPAELRDNIQERLKDRFAEEKRGFNALLKLENNLFAFKHGKYAKKLPKYCNNCSAKSKCAYYQVPRKEGDKIVCALRPEFKAFFKKVEYCKNREKEAVINDKDRILRVLLERATFGAWCELLDGGKENKNFTKLLLDIWDKLESIKYE